MTWEARESGEIASASCVILPLIGCLWLTAGGGADRDTPG